MKTLSLYIDRWYIVAAISSDNISRRIELPNREDRIWLYFYEDINNDRIIYGRNYQQHFLDKELHYHGDIFSKILKENETFKRFGKDVNLKDIFKAAGIFDHLRKDFSDNENVVTYVSFSVDVTPAAQKVFLDILNDNGFKVKESVARISHLALELSFKRGSINDSKSILVVEACNENLRYVVYKQVNSVFIRQAKEGVLRGYGTDLRGRALLEQIVWQINNSSKFLTKDEEEFEIVRLSQNLERWLLQLDNTKCGRPTIYNDITFSRTPYNKQSVTITKNVIEDRTKVTIDNLVDNISAYVKEISVNASDITHIVFIGNSFNNTRFKETLLQRYAVNDSNIIMYQDKELPEIVSIYNQMDLSQFDSLRADRERLSEEELEQIKIAEEERRKREEDSRRQEEIDQANAAVREGEKKFNAAIQEAENYEKKGDYSNMIDFLKIALTIKPDNTETKQLLEEANRKLSEVKVKNEQYNKAIRFAQDAFKEQRWQEAYSKSETALELRPDSEEAKRIKTESQRRIKLAETIKEFLLRADTYVKQKLYVEALEELNKAKYADANNEEVLLKIKEIEDLQNKSKKELETLIEQLNEAKAKKDFEKAIETCNNLLKLDSLNQIRWTEEISDLKNKLAKLKADEERFEQLKVSINNAQFEEDWNKVVELCNELLSIKDDDHIRNVLKRAEGKNQILKEQEEFDKSVSDIKSLIADKMLGKASTLTKDLQRKYPEHNDIVKKLFKMIFEAEEGIDKMPTSSTSHKPIGFELPSVSTNPNMSGKNNSTKKEETSTKGSNFFDDNVSSNNIVSTRKITNDDFDF